MFTKKVTDDDNFMALSASAQALYLHLSMCADDDGFCNQVSISMFKAHASIQDLQALLEKRYIYQFENGVIVIKHWRMANALRKDRYTPTAFQEELAKLDVKENGSYTWLPDGCQVVAECLPQDSIGKNRIEEDSIGKVSKGKKTPTVYYPADDLLNQAFTDYVEMRKKLKSPMTERAIQLAIGNLEKLSGGDNDIAVQILEQSVMNSWKGLFALKEDKRSNNAGGIDWSKV
jgi:hypothetical protein